MSVFTAEFKLVKIQYLQSSMRYCLGTKIGCLENFPKPIHFHPCDTLFKKSGCNKSARLVESYVGGDMIHPREN